MKLPVRKVLEIRAEKDGMTLTAEWIDDSDYVEVVRCKDCKWQGDKKYCMMIHGEKKYHILFEQDYCSYGERVDK